MNTPPDMTAYNARMDFARPMIAAAGAVALAYFRTELAVDNKRAADFDPVTQADKDVERFLRTQIAASFPDDAVIGEEEAAKTGNGDWSWIIDPIDGTRAFISGLPEWGILLGLRYRGRVMGGFMHQPYLGEIFEGRGEATRLHRGGLSRRLESGHISALKDAIMTTTHPVTFIRAPERAAFHRLEGEVKLSRYGGDCYAYCLLAMGHIDLVIDGSLQAYDIEPLIPIIENAGGVVTDIHGRRPENIENETVIAAATPELHKAALAGMQT